jgi:hypothetical protein
MRETDLRECETALRTINFFLKGSLSFRKTLANLRGVIVLLGENETALSKALRSKWRVLEEIDAYATYQKAPAVSGEKQILIDTTLDQMRTILFEAMGGVRQSDEEQSGSKLVSGILLRRN